MYIHFDKQNLELKAICGILEEYKPSNNIQLAYQKTKELQDKVKKFMDEVFNPAIKEIDQIISEENSKYLITSENTKE